jgi:glycosyltransferase involved in cell wall biosynthesis
MRRLKSIFSLGRRVRPVRPLSGAKSPSCQASQPRLLVDVSVIVRHDAQTGIQRVVRAVWTNLLERSQTAFDVVPVYANRTHGYRYASRDFLTRPADERVTGTPVRARPGDRFLGLDLSAHLLPSHVRQIRRWRTKGMTTHLVVYDLLPLQRPDWFNERTVRNFRRWIEVVRSESDQALCISDQVARELRELFAKEDTSPEIGRLRLAGDIEASFPSRGIDAHLLETLEHIRRGPAVLMVGTIEPRKAYDVALAAFDHIWKNANKEAPSLVIVGKPGWRTDALQELFRNHPERGRHLFWLPNVSDEGLARLYEACSAVFLASHAEGFGLPAIEAAMHGRHALVRDLPVFREQRLGNLSYFVDDRPERLAEDLVDLVQRATNEPAIPVLPSWDDCVTDMLQQIGLGEQLPPTPVAERSRAA